MVLRHPHWLRYTTLTLIAAGATGCAGPSVGKAERLLAKGHTAEGVQMLQQLDARNPQAYRLKYVSTRDRITRALLAEADTLQRQGKLDEALNRYRDILAFDARNAGAIRGLELIARAQRHADTLAQAQAAADAQEPTRAQGLLGEILAENPDHAGAKALKQRLDLARNRELVQEPALKAALRKPVALEFRNASIQSVFDVLAQSAGINFIFDRDVKTELKTTIYARNTSIEDALALILRTNQLQRKALNDSTLLIYPDTPEKAKQYQELVTRSFYLGAADPKKVQELVRTMAAPKAMYVDDKMRLLVVRDSLNVIEAIERLVSAYDLADPEVTLEVEILEVSTDKLLNVGIQYPDQISASVTGAAAKAGQLTIDELKNLHRDNFKLFVPDPLAVVNFRQTSGEANILANPRIRVRNREKAKVLIGDKVPVVTTTTNQTSSSVSESVSYLDVGLKLEVEPEVHVNNDVSMTVGLEVSSIVKEVKSSTGLLTYQIGTRNANTVLRLHDGETQMLAGLIKKEQRESASHLPGLGKLPLLGRLFSNQTDTSTKSEIVLLITPHVVRSLNTPDVSALEFSSGTGDQVSVNPFRLTPAARYSATDAKVMAKDKASPTASSPTVVPTLDSPATPMPVEAAGPATDATPLVLGGNGDSALPALRFDMVAPAQIPANKEFTLALLVNGPGFEQLDLDLEFGQPGMEVVRANAVAPSASFSYSPTGQGVHLQFGATPGHSGPLAMLTLKASQAGAQPVDLSLTQITAKTAADQTLPATATPRQLLVTP